MIRIFKSPSPTNFFSPFYQYFLYENIFDFDVDKLKNYILSIEKDIIKNTKPEGDGRTGLGKKSLTSRHMSFNLFNLNETIFLKNSIKDNLKLFFKELKIPMPNAIYGKCWANVMRKGDQIKRHRHSIESISFLSGHFCVEINKTNTYYINSFDDTAFISENKPGKITIFPSWIEHYTDIASSRRITIAFDLVLHPVKNGNFVLI
jgi:hypothetical protein